MNVRKYFAIKTKNEYRLKGEGWTENHKVYGIFKNDICVYIGRSVDFMKRLQQHTKYRDICYVYKLLKLGENKKLNWEKIYIHWYSLKYDLDNKQWNLKGRKLYQKDKMRLSDFYRSPWHEYKRDIILRYHLF
jgi:predicted GIY-YIG superfamily endonuclease